VRQGVHGRGEVRPALRGLQEFDRYLLLIWRRSLSTRREGFVTLQEARKIIEEIHERYGIQFSEVQEKRENGQIRTIYVTLKLRLDAEKVGLKKMS